MPRKYKYPNNEESPIHDTEADPFAEENEAPADVIEKVEKKEVDTRCTCATIRNKNCAIHRWSDRDPTVK